MVRVADAMTGHHARAALVTNPRGAAYRQAYAGGICSGMAEIVAFLYAGATQAGIEFGESASGGCPTPRWFGAGFSSGFRRRVRQRRKPTPIALASFWAH